MSRSFLCFSLLLAMIACLCQPVVWAGSEKQAHTHHSTHTVLVPPPPPEIPLIGGGSTDEHLLSTLGVPLDYMSKADLQNMQTRLAAAAKKLQKEKAEHDSDLAHKKDRAQKFEDLFKEGVVSRRELEMARKELAEMQENAPDLDQRLKDVQTDLARVQRQLDVIDKRQAKKNSTKKTIAHQ